MSSPAIPEHLKKYQQKDEAADAQSLADSGNPTIPRLSIKGGKFRWIEGEDESKKFNAVDVVVVGVDPSGGRMNKSFYKKAFDPANPEPPDCSSINGVVPDSWVAEPQASRCAKCPQNAFGTAVNAQGQRTKGKACKDSKWLWVVKLEEITEESPKVWCLNVPASSLKTLSKFGREVGKTGMPLHVVHARLEMDDDFDYPVIDIQLKGFLETAEACEAAEELHESMPWRDLVGDTDVPQAALASQTAEAQTMIEHSSPQPVDDDDDDEQTKPVKKVKKSETIDAKPEKPSTDSPDAAVENW